MSVAIFSDIHGNVSGLKAVLAALEARGPFAALVAAGDHLGGGPGAEDVLQLLVEHNVRLLRGNADECWADLDRAWATFLPVWQAVETIPDVERARQEWLGHLRPTFAWLQTRLSASDRELLASLPLHHIVDVAPGHRLLICHANPTTTWGAEQDAQTPVATLRTVYGQSDAEVIAHGHVHHHHILPFDGKLKLNVASVGARPRDDGLSAFTIVDYMNDHWVVEQYQVPYNREEDARLMVERQVPPL